MAETESDLMCLGGDAVDVDVADDGVAGGMVNG